MVVALKKSDLYSSLWRSADELRGGMDASQYKDYVLTLLFVKYVSDKAKADPYSLIAIPDGGSFDDLVAAKGKSRRGRQVNKSSASSPRPTALLTCHRERRLQRQEKLGEGRRCRSCFEPRRNLPRPRLHWLPGRG